MTIPRRVSEIDWSNWIAADPATLCFVIRDGEVLLIRKKRGLGAGKINAPGGRLETDESPQAAAIREVQEELRVTPTELQFCGHNRFQFVDGYSLHVHIFRAENCIGTPTETDEAVPLWYPVDEIPYREMWDDDRLWVPLLLQRRRFEGRFIFDREEMIDHHVEIAEQSLLD